MAARVTRLRPVTEPPSPTDKPSPPPAQPPREPALDNLTLARKEGWHAFTYAPPREPPDTLTARQLQNLSPRARSVYDRQRRVWHANLPTIKTPQVTEIQDILWDIVDSNLQFGDKAKGAIGLEGPPGIGKTCCVQGFGREFHRREVAELGDMTAAGHERWPVCRVGMTGNTGMKEFNRAMLAFFNHAGAQRGTTAQFADRALDCVLSCETRLLIVDDLHFLRIRTNSVEISNQFKYISNEFPLTIVFVGIGLAERGLYSDGTHTNAVLGQTGRRTTALTMRGFSVIDDEHRAEWRKLLLTLEKRVVLVHKRPGMLAEDLSDYLYARSSGRMGSLMSLLTRGCQRAVRDGTERLTTDLLDTVPIDAAAEKRRAELDADIRSGRMTTTPRRRGGRART